LFPNRRAFGFILNVQYKVSLTLLLQMMFYFSLMVTPFQFIVSFNSSLSLARLEFGH
jgi:hypothetical protein